MSGVIIQNSLHQVFIWSLYFCFGANNFELLSYSSFIFWGSRKIVCNTWLFPCSPPAPGPRYGVPGHPAGYARPGHVFGAGRGRSSGAQLEQRWRPPSTKLLVSLRLVIISIISTKLLLSLFLVIISIISTKLLLFFSHF